MLSVWELGKLRQCHEIKRCLLLGRKVMTTLDSILKSRDITLLTKGQSSQSYGFSSSQVWIWELDHKEGWMPKNWWLWIVPEKTLENPLDCKEIKPVSPKGNQPWIFTERTDAESEAPVLWTPDVKSQLTRKVSDAGKDWGQEEKGEKEDEMVGCHHWLNGYELEQTLGDSEGQGSLSCKELDTTEQLDNNNFMLQSSEVVPGWAALL